MSLLLQTFIQKYRKIPLIFGIHRLYYTFVFMLVVVIIMVYIQIQNCNFNSNKQKLPASEKLLKFDRINPKMDKYLHKNLRCYADRNLSEDTDLYKIDDILLNERQPRKGKTIFFYETSCSKTARLQLNAHQLCAIESAALLNPNFDVFVLFASQIGHSTKQNQSKYDIFIQKTLKSYKNIYLRNVNLWKYADDTPIQEWLDYGKLFYSHYIEQHVSDLLRFITLWRWGGTHLDFDIILIKTLENIKPNYVAAETTNEIGNYIINLDYNGIGHQIANMLLEKSETNFNPYLWKSIGSRLITKVIKQNCKIDITELMTRDRCSGVKVFDQEAFNAIDLDNIKYFFDENNLEMALSLTNKSIGINICNKHFTIKVGSNVAYGIYANKYCPKVYNSCGKFF